MRTLDVLIPGRPVPKGRPRVGKNGRAHTPERTRAYEAHARAAVHFACLAQKWAIPAGDVSVQIVLTFDTLVHGDVDNCAKVILDAANGVLFRDDKSVRSLHVWRRWANEQHPEGFELTVSALADDPRPKPKRKPRQGRLLVTQPTNGGMT